MHPNAFDASRRVVSKGTTMELLLFATGVDFVARAVVAGVDTVVVDLENIGKRTRQAAANTQISESDFSDLARVRRATRARLVCRVNSGAHASDEARRALALGADEVLLPMVRSAREVLEVQRGLPATARVGIMVETT